MEGKEETPHWESKSNNNLNSIYLSKFIGKCCDISFEKGVIIPPISKGSRIYIMQATILGYDSSYLFVEFFQKKKYTSILKINNIDGITCPEN